MLQDDDVGRRILASGYLPARSTSQFVVIRSGPAKKQLRVEENSGDNPAGGITVENQLGIPIEHLWIADSQGQLFTSDTIAPGQRLQPRTTTPAEARRVLALILSANEPRLPAGFDADYQPNMFVRNRGWAGTIPGLDQPATRTSILEHRVREIRELAALSPRSYLVVTDTSPLDVPLGTPRIQEEASFHVIRGHW
jgi:hypothetical protein